MRKAANAAGMSETLDRYAKDYPAGPHDQPQSMCPAFGSLRVGLRMRRTATILSGSACCVYGLTFTSHFYGATPHRRLRAVQLGDAGHRQAVRGHPRGGVQARGARRLRRHRHHQSLRADRLRRAAAAAAEGDRRRPHHRHRRAGLRRADPCGSQGRAGRRHAAIRPQRGRAGPRAGAARRPRANSRQSRCWARCSPPIPSASARMLEPMGLAAGPVVPTREWRELYAALDCAAVAAIHPFYTASHPRIRSGRPADRRLRAGRASTARPTGSKPSAQACGVAREKVDAAQEPPAAGDPGRARGKPIAGRITLSGYEGSELLVARLLVESGADLRYVGTACPRTRWSDADREWLEAQGRPCPVPRLAGAGSRGAAGRPSRTSPSARRRWCRRRSRWPSRRSTSPT